MKRQMFYEIVKNLGRLLSVDFWRAIKKDPFFLKGFVLLVFFGAISDIIKMITVPGYPPEKGAAR